MCNQKLCYNETCERREMFFGNGQRSLADTFIVLLLCIKRSTMMACRAMMCIYHHHFRRRFRSRRGVIWL